MNTKRIKTISVQYDKWVFWALTLLIITCMSAYGLLVGIGVLHIVERNTVEDEIIQMNSHISELESLYLSRLEEVNLAHAKDFGLVETSHVVYVVRKDSGQHALSINFPDDK